MNLGKIEARLNELLAKKWLFYLVILCIYLGVLLYTLKIGQDFNWDLQNYHFYNPYALLNNRISLDLLPAGNQTGHSPLADIPVYLLIINFPPIMVGLLLATIQFLNFFLIYKIIGVTLKTLFSSTSKSKQLILAILSFSGAAMLGTLGGSMQDGIVSIPILFSVLFVLERIENKEILKVKNLLILGVLVGFFLALKLTSLVFLPAFVLGLLVCSKINRKNVFKIIIVFSSVVILSYIIVQSPWMILMSQKYHSPMYPYFNSIFHSPFLDNSSFFDKRFLPRNFFEYLIYPIVIAKNFIHVAEVYFRDYRILIIYLVSILAIASLFLKRKVKLIVNLTKTERFLFVFYITAGIGWLVTSSIYRYFVVLEILSILMIYILIKKWLILIWGEQYKKAFTIIFWGLMLFLFVSVKPLLYDHVPWQMTSYFGISKNQFTTIQDSTILLQTSEPNSYVLPFFPGSNKFIKIDKTPETETIQPFHRQIAQSEIDSAKKLYVLKRAEQDQSYVVRILKEYSLKQTDNCLNFSTVKTAFILCEVSRT